MKRLFGLLAGAGLIIGASAPNPATVFGEIRRDQPGCAASVMRDGRIVWAGGFGSADIATHRPIRPDTVFNIASISKEFTAFSILLLAEAGRLDLDDPIRRYVPELGTYADPVTLRMLLHHTGGIGDFEMLALMSGVGYDQKLTEEQTLRLVASLDRTEFPAGTRYSYSNTGFFLLSLVVERVTGQTMRSFVTSRIMHPLAMRDSTVVDHYPSGIDALARGYAQAGGGWKIDESRWENTGDGQVHTTVLDFMRWVRNLDTGEVGGRSIARRMQETGLRADGSTISYAMGLDIGRYRGVRTVGHDGSWAGYHSTFLWLPEKNLAVAVFCNFDDPRLERRARALVDMFAAFPTTPATTPLADSTLITAGKVAPADVRPGTYLSNQGRVVRIRNGRHGRVFVDGSKTFPLRSAGRLLIAKQDNGPLYLAPEAPDRLRSDGQTVFQLQRPFKPGDQSSFVGRYVWHRSPGVVDVFAQDGRLSLKFGGETTALVPIARDTFEMSRSGGSVKFDGRRLFMSTAPALEFIRQ